VNNEKTNYSTNYSRRGYYLFHLFLCLVGFCDFFIFDIIVLSLLVSLVVFPLFFIAKFFMWKYRAYFGILGYTILDREGIEIIFMPKSKGYAGIIQNHNNWKNPFSLGNIYRKIGLLIIGVLILLPLLILFIKGL